MEALCSGIRVINLLSFIVVVTSILCGHFSAFLFVQANCLNSRTILPVGFLLLPGRAFICLLLDINFSEWNILWDLGWKPLFDYFIKAGMSPIFSAWRFRSRDDFSLLDLLFVYLRKIREILRYMESRSRAMIDFVFYVCISCQVWDRAIITHSLWHRWLPIKACIALTKGLPMSANRTLMRE